MIDRNIKEMIESKDLDSRYLAVTMLRNSDLFNKQTKNLIKKVNLFERIKNYSDVCSELNIKELTLEDFKFLPLKQAIKCLNLHKIQNICLLFNENWILNWSDSSQEKYYPWFEFRENIWVVFGVNVCFSHSCGAPGFFKDEKIVEFCGKLFINEYNEYLNN